MAIELTTDELGLLAGMNDQPGTLDLHHHLRIEPLALTDDRALRALASLGLRFDVRVTSSELVLPPELAAVRAVIGEATRVVSLATQSETTDALHACRIVDSPVVRLLIAPHRIGCLSIDVRSTSEPLGDVLAQLLTGLIGDGGAGVGLLHQSLPSDRSMAISFDGAEPVAVRRGDGQYEPAPADAKTSALVTDFLEAAERS